MATKSVRTASKRRTGSAEDRLPERRSNEVQFFTRLASDLRDWLRGEVKKIPGLSEKDALHNILNYLSKANNPDLVRLVMSGQASPDPREIGTQVNEALATTGWAEHAFSRPFYSWAYEEFKNLFDVVGSRDLGLKRLGHFKVGYCLLEQAFELRTEALGRVLEKDLSEEIWAQYYDAADHCTYLALWHYKQVETLGGMHPVATYNRACAWSLRAQLAVEKALGHESHLMETIAKVAAQDADTTWEKFGQRWRVEIKDAEKRRNVELETEKYATNCFNLLNDLKRYDSDKGIKKQLYDIVFLYELAHKDRDLTFVRWDRAVRRDFARWLEGYDGSKLTSYNKVYESIPINLQEMSEPID